MKVIQGGRRAGKTHTLLQWVAEDHKNRCIITAHNAMAVELHRQLCTILAEKLGSIRTEDVWRCVHDISSAAHALRGRHVEVAFDNLDMILRSLAGVGPEVVGFTLTEPLSVQHLGVNEWLSPRRPQAGDDDGR